MINFSSIKTFINANEVKGFLPGKSPVIHGINPHLTNPITGIYYLPRFCSVEMKEAREMNQIAQKRLYENYSNNIPHTGAAEDIARLTSETEEDSYKRAVWINPKDKKPYYILEEGRDKDGKINVRILDKDVQFVKNAKLKPVEVILTDLAEASDLVSEIDGLPLSHTDKIELLARRYNPFANYKTMCIKKDADVVNLKNKIGPNTFCISASYGFYHEIPNIHKPGKEIEQSLLQSLKKTAPNEIQFINQLKNNKLKTRFLVSSGNDGENSVAGLLLNTGMEGVGGLNYNGTVDTSSASRNSLFTQHYEPFSYNATKTKYGFNISRLRGTDMAWDSDTPEGTLLTRINGTSFSAPVRAAKLSLNEMMRGVL